jgi:hypothetical protein
MKKIFTHMLIPKNSVGFLPWLGRVCLFLLTSFLVHAQERAVSGAVKDESGQPSSGAGLLVKSTSHGVTTDADGKHFTLLIIEKHELNQI